MVLKKLFDHMSYKIVNFDPKIIEKLIVNQLSKWIEVLNTLGNYHAKGIKF